jgi:hypothetical protein
MKSVFERIICALIISSVAAGLLGCDRSREPLTDREKTLIDKTVSDKKNLTSDEQKELQKLLNEKNEAERYLGQKEHQKEMKNWSKKSTTKPSKDFP